MLDICGDTSEWLIGVCPRSPPPRPIQRHVLRHASSPFRVQYNVFGGSPCPEVLQYGCKNVASSLCQPHLTGLESIRKGVYCTAYSSPRTSGRGSTPRPSLLEDGHYKASIPLSYPARVLLDPRGLITYFLPTEGGKGQIGWGFPLVYSVNARGTFQCFSERRQRLLVWNPKADDRCWEQVRPHRMRERGTCKQWAPLMSAHSLG